MYKARGQGDALCIACVHGVNEITMTQLRLSELWESVFDRMEWTGESQNGRCDMNETTEGIRRNAKRVLILCEALLLRLNATPALDKLPTCKLLPGLGGANL